MAYPTDDPVSLQILEALKAKMEAIATGNGNHHSVRQVSIFDSGPSVLGWATPAVAIVQVADDYQRSFTCLVDERVMLVDLFGVLRIDRMAPEWKSEVQRLIGDMKFVLAADIKISNTCTYYELVSEDTYEPGDDSLAMVKLSIRIVYRHQTLDPTALDGIL